MELIILGSGGNVPTPRISCNCEVCIKARIVGEPYRRNLASLYIKDINAVIDCPEDISDSLNRQGILDVDNVFITHWHPDHTFGLRLLIQANYDFIFDKCIKQITFYIPKKVYEQFKENYPAIEYFINVKKMGKLVVIEDGDKIEINNLIIEPKGYNGKNSTNYAYMISDKEKKTLYAPCDTIDLNITLYNLDVFISEQGYFSPEITWEISFNKLIDRIKNWKPKKTILTHISEDEIKRWSWKYLEKLELENSQLNIKFAYDGMIIKP